MSNAPMNKYRYYLYLKYIRTQKNQQIRKKSEQSIQKDGLAISAEILK